MDVAKEVLAGIVYLLAPEDQLSVVLFSDDGAAGAWRAPPTWLAAPCCLPG